MPPRFFFFLAPPWASRAAVVVKLRPRPQLRPLHQPERTRETRCSSAALSTSVSFPFPSSISIIRVSVFPEAWNCSSPFFFIVYMMTSDLLLSYTVVVTIPFSILRSSVSSRKTHLDLLNLLNHLHFKYKYNLIYQRTIDLKLPCQAVKLVFPSLMHLRSVSSIPE